MTENWCVSAWLAQASWHGPAFHPDQTLRIHTFPTACLQAISEIREPPRQRLQNIDITQMGFCLALAIPLLHLSDADIHPRRSTACGRCRVLAEPAFGCPRAQSQADCRSAQTRPGHCTAGWRSKVRRSSGCSFVHSNLEGQCDNSCPIRCNAQHFTLRHILLNGAKSLRRDSLTSEMGIVAQFVVWVPTGSRFGGKKGGVP